MVSIAAYEITRSLKDSPAWDLGSVTTFISGGLFWWVFSEYTLHAELLLQPLPSVLALVLELALGCSPWLEIATHYRYCPTLH